MNSPRITAEAEYRRGAVLGLTVAEIFVLLLFLLLLVFLGVQRSWQRQSEEDKAQLAEAQERLEPLERWQPVIDEFEAPEEIVTLQRQRQEAVQSAAQYRRENETLWQLIEKGDPEGKEAARLVEELRREIESKQEAQRLADKAQEELRVLRVKGLNPPCWYQTVSDGKGGMREKPYYTFNAGVFDEHIVILPREPPPGSAEDDNGGAYALEAEALELGELPYGIPLEDSDVLRLLQPLHNAGKDKRVRSYSCIFWVRVWDKTSPGAKARWKRAHDEILEGLFGAYTVKEDPWPEIP